MSTEQFTPTKKHPGIWPGQPGGYKAGKCSRVRCDGDASLPGGVYLQAYGWRCLTCVLDLQAVRANEQRLALFKQDV